MTDNSITILSEVTAKLKQYKLTIVTAESCTGGLIAGQLTERSGSSVWFDRGFVTYSNLAKQQLLAVDAALLAGFGSVSSEVAKAMALGALQQSQATLALAVTGIAGPGGGSKAKPVGSVYFAFAARNGFVEHHHQQFEPTNRQNIRLSACYYALQQLTIFIDKVR